MWSTPHQARWNLLRMKMARPLSARIMHEQHDDGRGGGLLEVLLGLRGQSSRSACGSAVIWLMHARRVERGPTGAVRRPASGAASPIARERPRIVPVAMPGTAEGRVCRQVVCHAVAPSASEPSRISSRHRAHRLAGGDDDDRQDQQRQRDRPAEDDAGLLEAHERHDRDRQQAVDDRRTAARFCRLTSMNRLYQRSLSANSSR